MPVRIHRYALYYSFLRDRSACVTLKRVPKPGGPEGQFVDEWMEYFRSESERNAKITKESLEDVSLRYDQVKKLYKNAIEM